MRATKRVALVGVCFVQLGSLAQASEVEPRADVEEARSFRMPSRSETRLVVVFHPDLTTCKPQEMEALRALQRVSEEFSDIEIVTVFPEGVAVPDKLFGERIPGRRLQIPSEAYSEEGHRAPRPRLEVWSRDGKLLFLSGLHPSVREERLFESVLWARAFTASPLRE